MVIGKKQSRHSYLHQALLLLSFFLLVLVVLLQIGSSVQAFVTVARKKNCCPSPLSSANTQNNKETSNLIHSTPIFTSRTCLFFNNDNSNESEKQSEQQQRMKTNNNVTSSSPLSPSPSDNNNNKNNNNKNIFATLSNTIIASPVFRTLLFTGALYGSPTIRNFLHEPGMVTLFLIILARNVYESKFNELVDLATPQRQEAIKQLRQALAMQLQGKSSSTDSNGLEYYKQQYEMALRYELQTRVIIPKLWTIPMDPSQEDWAAAPQLIKKKITNDLELVDIITNNEE